MKEKTKAIIKELKDKGLIKSETDLTANDKTSILFDYMLNKYSYLLENDLTLSIKDNTLKSDTLFNKFILKYGKYFLSNPQIFEPNSFNINDYISNEPVIFVCNHHFKDDILSSIIASKSHSYIVFGSLPQFYNTLDGLISAINGVVMVNRKEKESKKTSIIKAKYILDHNINLLMCPEGVWNKSPNNITLDLWSGFYRIAKKNDNTFYKVIPIVHYINNTHSKGKDNPIHTIVGTPIDFTNMSEESSVQYLKEVMDTMYWNMMEKYGKTTREELLNGYKDANEAWEDELEKRIATASKYDIEIETTADKQRKDTELKVWEPISNLDITKSNAYEVTMARKKVKELKQNDYQHRY